MAIAQSLLRVVPKTGAAVVHAGYTEAYTLDGEGRLYSAFVHGRTFRRAYDGTIMEKHGSPGKRGAPWIRRRRVLTAEEAGDLVNSVYERLRRSPVDGMAAEDALWPGGPRFADWWEKTGTWDAGRLAADAGRFRSVYAPIGILPPDQYRAVVVQATVGCSYNHCTFCNFYRHEGFRVRPPVELQAHLAAVRGYFGDALAGRRWLFCGEGNALAQPTGQLDTILQTITAALPVAPPSLAGEPLRAWAGAHPVGFTALGGFLDVLGGYGKDAGDWAHLRSLGLRRAFIGLETGHDPLRRFVRKPGDAAQARRSIEAVRAGGIDTALIIMVGVGGRPFAAGHVRDTLALLEAMRLGPQDLVYLSPYFDRPDTEYSALAAAAGVEEMDDAEKLAQYQQFVRALRRPGGPRVAVYDIREFLY